MKNIIIAIIILGLMAISVLGVVSHSAAEVIPGSFQVGSYIFPGLITFQSSINMSGNRITNVATPTSDSDAATKAYVDASGGSGSSYGATGKGVEYLGVTSSTYSGALGGLPGAALKCEAQYGTGARMMTTVDIADLGADAPTGYGWYHCSDTSVVYDGTEFYYYCEGASRGSTTYDQYSLSNCNGWQSSGYYDYGGYYPIGLANPSSCQTARGIHCVRDVYDSFFEEGGNPYFCTKKDVYSNGMASDSGINDGAQCDSSTETYCDDGSCSGIVNDTYMIYITSGTTTGAMGGRDGADTFCRDNMPEAVDCGDVHAFISLSGADEIQDMPTKYYPAFDDTLPVYWAHSTTGALTKMAENFTDMLDSSILVSATTGAGVSGAVWSFSTAVGAYNPSYYCSGGTATTGSGYYGNAGSVNYYWLSYNAATCSTSYRLQCFCRGFE